MALRGGAKTESLWSSALQRTILTQIPIPGYRLGNGELRPRLDLNEPPGEKAHITAIDSSGQLDDRLAKLSTRYDKRFNFQQDMSSHRKPSTDSPYSEEPRIGLENESRFADGNNYKTQVDDHSKGSKTAGRDFKGSETYKPESISSIVAHLSNDLEITMLDKLRQRQKSELSANYDMLGISKSDERAPVKGLDAIPRLNPPGNADSLATFARSGLSSNLTPLVSKVVRDILRETNLEYSRMLQRKLPYYLDMLEIQDTRLNGATGLHSSKHLKRHDRPYGCTFPECNKTFGSKNDWKRHENSQHFQLESWRCHEPTKESEYKHCAKVFFRRETFQQHLRSQHDIQDQDRLAEESRSKRIGRSGQSQFWCGFCVSILKLRRRGLPAWDERFDHLGEHFKTQTISQWVPFNANKPKEELSESKSDTTPDQDNEDEGIEEEFDIRVVSERPKECDSAMSGEGTAVRACPTNTTTRSPDSTQSKQVQTERISKKRSLDDLENGQPRLKHLRPTNKIAEGEAFVPEEWKRYCEH
ncbi:MAG: hypothetical protein M1833_004400 [Piccolia ochrophora]|nr:MAG: hypothetical protein M1833_004400 [Piccolia ochrophora]